MVKLVILALVAEKVVTDKLGAVKFVTKILVAATLVTVSAVIFVANNVVAPFAVNAATVVAPPTVNAPVKDNVVPVIPASADTPEIVTEARFVAAALRVVRTVAPAFKVPSTLAPAALRVVTFVAAKVVTPLALSVTMVAAPETVKEPNATAPPTESAPVNVKVVPVIPPSADTPAIVTEDKMVAAALSVVSTVAPAFKTPSVLVPAAANVVTFVTASVDVPATFNVVIVATPADIPARAVAPETVNVLLNDKVVADNPAKVVAPLTLKLDRLVAAADKVVTVVAPAFTTPNVLTPAADKVVTETPASVLTPDTANVTDVINPELVKAATVEAPPTDNAPLAVSVVADKLEKLVAPLTVRELRLVAAAVRVVNVVAPADNTPSVLAPAAENVVTEVAAKVLIPDTAKLNNVAGPEVVNAARVLAPPTVNAPLTFNVVTDTLAKLVAPLTVKLDRIVAAAVSVVTTVAPALTTPSVLIPAAVKVVAVTAAKVLNPETPNVTAEIKPELVKAATVEAPPILKAPLAVSVVAVTPTKLVAPEIVKLARFVAAAVRVVRVVAPALNAPTDKIPDTYKFAVDIVVV